MNFPIGIILLKATITGSKVSINYNCKIPGLKVILRIEDVTNFSLPKGERVSENILLLVDDG